MKRLPLPLSFAALGALGLAAPSFAKDDAAILEVYKTE